MQKMSPYAQLRNEVRNAKLHLRDKEFIVKFLLHLPTEDVREIIRNWERVEKLRMRFAGASLLSAKNKNRRNK